MSNLKLSSIKAPLAATLLLLTSNLLAGVSVERTSTFTDDNGGTAVTIGEGQFREPGGEFDVTAVFTNFMPREEGHSVTGQLNTVSSVNANDQGLLSTGAIRSTVINGTLTFTSAAGETVNVELEDVAVVDSRGRGHVRGRNRGAERAGNPVRHRHRDRNRVRAERPEGERGEWDGTIIVNGETMSSEQVPPKVKGAVIRLLGLMRH